MLAITTRAASLRFLCRRNFIPRGCRELVTAELEASASTRDDSHSFAAMGLAPQILQALAGLEILRPTDIQQRSIPRILRSPEDNFALDAVTGSGKTLCYILPIVQRALEALGAEGNQHLSRAWVPPLHALVLVANRTLATQVSAQIAALVSLMQTAAVVPATNLHDFPRRVGTVHGLARPHYMVYVATPAEAERQFRGSVRGLDSVRIAVADEADLLLRDGTHRHDTRQVLHALQGDAHLRRREAAAGRDPPALSTGRNLQILLAGATLNHCRAVAELTLPRLAHITSDTKQHTVPAQLVERFVVVHNEDDESEGDAALWNEMAKEESAMQTALVFVRSCAEARRIAEQVRRRLDGRVPVAEFHSEIDEADRETVLVRAAAAGARAQVVVCTDMLARGVDLPRVTHVFQRMQAYDATMYRHRVGRTAREGGPAVAVAISLCGAAGRNGRNGPTPTRSELPMATMS